MNRSSGMRPQPERDFCGESLPCAGPDALLRGLQVRSCGPGCPALAECPLRQQILLREGRGWLTDPVGWTGPCPGRREPFPIRGLEKICRPETGADMDDTGERRPHR